MSNRKNWKHKAFRKEWPQCIFIGEQKACQQAFRDCEVPLQERSIWGVDASEYSLVTTGEVVGKKKTALLKRRSVLVVD